MVVAIVAAWLGACSGESSDDSLRNQEMEAGSDVSMSDEDREAGLDALGDSDSEDVSLDSPSDVDAFDASDDAEPADALSDASDGGVHGEGGPDGSVVSCGNVLEPCCAGNSCASGLGCEAGQCIQKPIGEAGKSCVKDSDCDSGICLPIGNGKNACSQLCKNESDCVPGWECGGYAGQPGKVCKCEAKAEECNGFDDDCNGIVDDILTVDAKCKGLHGIGYACIAGQCDCKLFCNGDCVDGEKDPKNCGSCDNWCAAGGSCTASICTCPGAQPGICSGTCKDLAWDRMNCGACGKECTNEGESCISGVCSCPHMQNPAICNGVCQDLARDNSHCGTCDNACVITCSGGACLSVAEIALGDEHSCARMSDGSARCWGSNDSYKLGIGTGSSSYPVSLPTPVTALANVVELSLGDSHSCARLSDGKVRCWGSDRNGQIGTHGGMQPVPVEVSGLSGVVQIAAGGAHTCARLDDATVSCFGANGYGQLGNGSTGGSQLQPTEVSGLSSVLQVALGDSHSCALLTNKTVKCWGYNGQGQLGDGSHQTRTTPTTVAGLTDAVEIAVAGNQSCARTSNGKVQCWGTQSFAPDADLDWGDDGNPDGGAGPEPKGSLREIASLSNVVQLALGNRHACARIHNGTVHCWGQSGSGQLGNGNYWDSASPVQVSGILNATGISLGGSHSCARLGDGTLRCWGDNGWGQLGDGTSTNRASPALVKW